MNEELMITKEDLVNWLNRPPSNDDLDLIGFITTRLENFYKLEQENIQLKEANEKLYNVLDNIGYLIEGLIYHTDNKSTISKHNEKVLRSILEKIDKRDVSILGDKENE